MELSEKLFLLKTPDMLAPEALAALKAELLEDIFAHGAPAGRRRSPPALSLAPADRAPLYAHCCETLGWLPDAARLAEMRSRNAATLEQLVERCARRRRLRVRDA